MKSKRQGGSGGGTLTKHYQTMDGDISTITHTADPQWGTHAIFRNVSRDRSSDSSLNNESPLRPTKKTVFRHETRTGELLGALDQEEGNT